MKNTVLNFPFIFPISILLLVVILFMFSHPSIITLVNPTHRSDLIATFLHETSNERHIDEQHFWSTREFYSPGSFTYNHDGLDKNTSQTRLKELNIKLNTNIKVRPFLTFTSKGWKSIEFLTSMETLAQTIKDPLKNDSAIVLQNDHELIYYTDPQTLRILFVKPITEMKNANGFFDYAGHDKALLEGTYWLSISEVTLE